MATIPATAGPEPYSGPTASAGVVESFPITDFQSDIPTESSGWILRVVFREAVGLADAEKQGKPGGGQTVPFPVRGNVLLSIPWKIGKPDWAQAFGEIIYVGSNRISYRGPVEEDPAHPLVLNADRVTGSIIFPYEIGKSQEEKTQRRAVEFSVDLVISLETHGYTKDPDPSIPFWRADKTKPSGRTLTGTWTAAEPGIGREKTLSGRIEKVDGSFGILPHPGLFFPVQGVDLGRHPGGGMHLKAHAAPGRVDAGDSQWAVKELAAPLDLRKANGLKLTLRSKVMAGGSWNGAAPVAAALAVRAKGSSWYACRTATPLLGGEQSTVVDFQLFERGSANPGYGAGPNLRGFLDLSCIDAVAVGVANPFGVGTVEFTALHLEAVRFREHGSGEIPEQPVIVTVDAAGSDVFNGVSEVPKGLFGYHLAHFNLQGKEKGPSWFEQPPVGGEGLALLRLCQPGFLRPLDHTSMQGKKGSDAVRVLAPEVANAGDALDSVVTTVTNENLWARPRWMDEDLDQYTEGIRAMFVEVGKKGYTHEQPQNTLRRIEFWNEPFMWARHINRGESRISAGPGDAGGNLGRRAWNDPTQFTFIPGQLGGEIYAKFFNAAAEGLRRSNPEMEIGGMSSPAFGDDFCAVLQNYVGVFLEKSKDHLHFLTEHHYGGLAQRYAADYEIVTGYTVAKFGKSWPIWNTETNDLDDIAPGDRRSPEAAQAFTDMNRAYYNYRDILEIILKSRDKARGRALHALWQRGWFQNRGEYELFRHTAELRGPILQSSATDPVILPVAVKGQDRVVIYILNDSPFPRKMEVRLPGLAVTRPVEACGLRMADDESQTSIFSSEVSVKADPAGAKIVFKAPLRPREIAKLVVMGTPNAAGKGRRVRQYFSDIVLANLRPGEQRKAHFSVPRQALEQSKIARVRLVARDVQTGEFKLKMGNNELWVPATTAESAHHRVVDLELPGKPSEWARALGKEGLPIEMEAAKDRDGFAVYTMSLLLDEVP